MNELVIIQNGSPVTTTLAIAEGTENEHASVIKLVRAYLADLEVFGRVGFEIDPFETAGGTQTREVAILNERQATLLLTYMRNNEIVRTFKIRLVKKFFEMAEELKQLTSSTQDTPERRAIERIKCDLEVAKLFNVPEHIAQIEAVKQAHTLTGIDYGHLLTHSPAQNHIEAKDEMLGPAELGKRFDRSAQSINKVLAKEGYQLKGKTSWIPTALGEKFCTKHAWRKGFKSGYNLKWQVSLLDRLLQISDLEEVA